MGRGAGDWLIPSISIYHHRNLFFRAFFKALFFHQPMGIWDIVLVAPRHASWVSIDDSVHPSEGSMLEWRSKAFTRAKIFRLLRQLISTSEKTGKIEGHALRKWSKMKVWMGKSPINGCFNGESSINGCMEKSSINGCFYWLWWEPKHL